MHRPIGSHRLFGLVTGSLLCAVAGAHGLAAQQRDLTVMSFNIRYGTADDGADRWSERAGLAVEVIRAHAPDLLGVQEALRAQLDLLSDSLPEYAEIGVGRDDGLMAGEYAALLVRRERFAMAASGTFWLSERPDVPGSMDWGNRITRICTWTRLVDRHTGRGLWVFNVHFDHESAPARERSAELVAARLEARMPREPVVVMGDFNAGDDEAPMRYLRGDLDRASAAADVPPSPDLRDTFREVHPHATEVGTFHGFRGGTAGGRIDAILVSREWSVRDATIVRWHRGGRYPSDHYPVIATILLP